MNSSTLIVRSVAPSLPYDCMNRIFEYLSHMIDAKFALEFDANGHVHMRINPYSGFYTNISAVFHYKRQIIGGKYLTLRLPDLEAEALEQPRPLGNQATLDANLANGYMDFGWCYSYTNPLNHLSEYVYTSARYYLANNQGVFLGGILLRDGSAYNVTDYSAREAEGVVNIQISPFNLDWAQEEAVTEAAEGLLLLNNNNAVEMNLLDQEDMDIEWE